MAKQATARELLVQNRLEAQKLAQKIGGPRLRKILEASERDLLNRLRSKSREGKFTYEQSRVALAQVREVLKDVKAGIKDTLVENAVPVAEKAAEGTVEYLGRMDSQFKGIVQPIALDEASVFERAINGAQTSVLRRLASSGEPVAKADGVPHKAKEGILERYGMNTLQHFEDILQKGVLGKKSWMDMRAEITDASPFLLQMQTEGAQRAREQTAEWRAKFGDAHARGEWVPRSQISNPAMWAERIVRTESMAMYNRASWESNREAQEQLEDMVKILSATFDDRTASDSYACHGQIRRPDEAFETWFGLMQHPPNRPNDREIVVPHRISWPLPASLRWRTQEEIAARWAREHPPPKRPTGRERPKMPPRPTMTTIPLERFGNG